MQKLWQKLKPLKDFVLGLILIYIIFCFLISLFKTVNSCGETWGVERFIQADWFCDVNPSPPPGER